MSKPMSEQMQKLANRYEKATGKKFNTKTNAQKIRSMTDEELANIIECPYGNPYFDEHLPCKGSCHDCLLIWLKQSAEEDDHAICGATNLPCIKCNPGGCNNRKEGAD